MALTAKKACAQLGEVKLVASGNRARIDGVIDDFNYHVWLDITTLQPIRDTRSSDYAKGPVYTVYKNKVRAPGERASYKTRYLDPDKGEGAIVWDVLRSQIPKLEAQMRAEAEAEARSDAEARTKAEKEEKELQAGPLLCKVLVDLLPLIQVHASDAQLKAVRAALKAAGETVKVRRAA